MRITIFGLGRVGSTLAAHLIASSLPISDIHIYDHNLNKMHGEYLDLINFATILNKETRITIGYDSPADVCIIAAGIPRSAGERSFDYEMNRDIAVSCLVKCPDDAIVFLATNPVDKIAEHMKLMFPSRKIVPIGDYLYQARSLYATDPEEYANLVVDQKGFSNFGCIGEILLRLMEMPAEVSS